MIPVGARGVGGGLCPWSRCLTWAKPAKQPHCQGSRPGCKPGQRGQMEGDRRYRAGAVHRGNMPSKTNHQLYFLTQSIVCLSVLLLSPVTASTSQTKHTEVFSFSPSHLSFLTFCMFFFLIICVHKHTVYSVSYIHQLILPILSGCLFLIINLLCSRLFPSFQEGKRRVVCSRF